MGIDHGCFNMLVPKNSARSGWINSIHLHKAVKSMAEVVDSGQVVKSSCPSHFDQCLPQIIAVKLATVVVCEHVTISLLKRTEKLD